MNNHISILTNTILYLYSTGYLATAYCFTFFRCLPHNYVAIKPNQAVLIFITDFYERALPFALLPSPPVLWPPHESSDKSTSGNVARHIQIIMKTVAVVQSCVYAMRPTYVIKIQQKSSENNEHKRGQVIGGGREGVYGGGDTAGAWK